METPLPPAFFKINIPRKAHKTKEVFAMLLDGWMDGWMDVWMDGWMDVDVDACPVSRILGHFGEQVTGPRTADGQWIR